MKAVAADAVLVEFARQRIGVVDPGMGAVKGGVEAGDLHGLREGGLRGADAGKVVRLVQRRQRIQPLQYRELPRVEHDGFAEVDAAMDDPVADAPIATPSKSCCSASSTIASAEA